MRKTILVVVIGVSFFGFAHATERTSVAAKGEKVADACVDLCKEKNRLAVKLCNYPAEQIAAQTKCLKTARSNFDACMQACGR